MRKFIAISGAVLTTVMALCFGSGAAFAQASRTWVSGVGDDANPCSRTVPCKTFAGAISKTATNGEIDCLDPGGFGALTITKSITIDCRHTLGSILVAGTNGINIPFDSFAASDGRRTVNLRGVSIEGLGTGLVGIQIAGSGATGQVNVEDCVIDGFFGGSATGISDQRNVGVLTVLNTTVRNMGTNGVNIASSNASGSLKTTLDNVRIMNANHGIVAGAHANVHVTRSVVVTNATGLTNSATGTLVIDSTSIVQNATGVAAVPGGTVIMSNNQVFFNNAATTGAVLSYTTNRFNENNSIGTINAVGSASSPSGQL